LPIYYLFTILFVLKLVAAGTPWTWAELAFSLLFIPYVNADGLMQPIYSLGWTLNYEMYFYIVFAACLLLRRSIGITTVFVVITSVVLWGLFRGNFAPSGDPQDLFAFYAHPVALFFLAGMLIALAPPTLQASPAVCFTLSAVCILAGILSRQPAILAATCIGAVFLSSIERAPVRASVAEKSMEILGEASYSIYLTHSFVLGPAVAIGLKLGLWNGPVGYIYASVCLIACAIAGTIAYLIAERPALRFIRDYRTRVNYARPVL
jgi:peptidoglycan/LPS O-acetylase OafA/YrhL